MIFPSSLRRNDVLLFVVALLVLFSFSMGMRVLVHGKWSGPEFMVDGELIMSTPDAYYWLSGAVDKGRAQGSAVSVTVKRLTQVFGTAPGNVGYWLPPVLGALLGCIVFLWAYTLGRPEAGLCAGMLAGFAPNFFFRTHFGFLDTDMVTVLFPLFIAWGVAHGLRPYLKDECALNGLLRLWMPMQAETDSKAEEHLDAGPGGLRMTWAVLMGLFVRFADAWHDRIADYNIILFFMAVFVVVVFGRPGKRGIGLWFLILFGLAAFYNWFGAVTAGAIIVFMVVRPAWMRSTMRSAWPALLILAVIAFNLEGIPHELKQRVYIYIKKYIKPVSHAAEAGKQHFRISDFPAVEQSVSEARNIAGGVYEYFKLLHLWKWPALLGFLGYSVLVCFRPAALLLLPLAGLSLAGIKLGIRWSMFGAPVFSLGFAFGAMFLLDAVIKKFSRRRKTVSMAFAAILGIVFSLPYFGVYAQVERPVSTPSRQHCEVLKELGRTAKGRGMTWTWWDFGYLTNYYAGLKSFADGGAKQHGAHIFPLAKILAAENPQISAAMMGFCAQNGYAPWNVWRKMSTGKVQQFIESLGKNEKAYKVGEEQYLVVSAEYLERLHWITFYGSWNFIDRSSRPAKVEKVKQAFAVDDERGAIRLLAYDTPLLLKSLDHLTAGGTVHKRFRDSGPRLIINDAVKEAFVMDDRAYESTAVRFLREPAGSLEISREFEIVIDEYPYIRVYKMRREE